MRCSHSASRTSSASDPREAVESWKPDVVFNLLEQFHGEAAYDQNVASYLELLRIPYTGCNPRGLMLARGKDLSKKLVHYHRCRRRPSRWVPDGAQGQAPAPAAIAADRQELE